MDLAFSPSESKESVFKRVQNYLNQLQLTVVAKDMERPWGGFFVIDENQAGKFAQHFFPEVELNSLNMGGKLSPKILMVQPRQRLSWQYHHRRAEIWKLVAGEAGVHTSETDVQGPPQTLQQNEIIRLRQGQRHRLIGLNNWGMVSEIWQHTDASQPSDESDIVRLQDDFGR